MKRKNNPSLSLTKVRGKYAAALKNGVRIVVHTSTGDRVRTAKVAGNGKLVWKNVSAPPRTHGEAASR
jgi:hypothetical protein